MLISTHEVIRQLETTHAKKVAEYNHAAFHPKYSRRCAFCKKFFVGGDWRFAETMYCSKQCELADCKNKKILNPYAYHEIKMFWRDFGHTISIYEDLPVIVEDI